MEEATAIKAGLLAGNADIVTRALVFATKVEPQVLTWLDNVRVKGCKILAVILHESRHEKWLCQFRTIVRAALKGEKMRLVFTMIRGPVVKAGAQFISIGVDGAHASLKHTNIENMELADASNLIELGDLSVKKAKQTIHIF